VFLNPTDYLPFATKHSLRNILDGLLVVLQASAKKIQEAFGPDVSRRPGYRKALIEASIVTNAALAVYSLREEFGTVGPTGLNVVYGVYLLENRRVWTPQVSGMTARIGRSAARRGGTYGTWRCASAIRPHRIAHSNLDGIRLLTCRDIL
jgi:carbonic anhydrase